RVCDEQVHADAGGDLDAWLGLAVGGQAAVAEDAFQRVELPQVLGDAGQVVGGGGGGRRDVGVAVGGDLRARVHQGFGGWRADGDRERQAELAQDVVETELAVVDRLALGIGLGVGLEVDVRTADLAVRGKRLRAGRAARGQPGNGDRSR